MQLLNWIMDKLGRCRCGRKATWLYAPKGWLACDNCVPRGCGCNIEYASEWMPDGEEGVDWRWVLEADMDGEWEFLDNGKPFPCCEWMPLCRKAYNEEQ